VNVPRYYFYHLALIGFWSIFAYFAFYSDPSPWYGNDHSEDLIFFFIFAGFISLPVLFYMTALRMKSAFGLSPEMQWGLFISFFFVPVPGYRIVPWLLGFFIPSRKA